MNAEEVRRKLVVPEELKVTVEPSAIVGSPHDYIYIYLGRKEHEGAHIIISDAAEHGATGFIVGAYRHWEQLSDQVATVPTVHRVQQLVNTFIRLLGRGDLIGH